jgi:hypothetical protein
MTDQAFREGTQALIAELRVLRGAVDALREALTAAPADGESAEAPPACQHPEDVIVDFGVTNGQPDWLCKACGFRSVNEGASS